MIWINIGKRKENSMLLKVQYINKMKQDKNWDWMKNKQNSKTKNEEQ